MKKLLHTLLLFAVGLFAACQAPTSGGDVYLNDFLDDLTAQTDAGPAIRAALSHCARIRAARLILPGGELRIRPDLAVEKYQFISNNDEGLKRIAFDLVGLQDFTIEGADTKLLFTGFVSPFNLERCRNITIRNLSIDFTRTFHSEGTVRAAGNGWLDLEFPDKYRCDLTDGCLRFLDDEGRVYPYSSLLEFDTQRCEPAFHVDDYWLPAHTIPAERRPNGWIRIFRSDLKAAIGNTMVFGAARRLNPGITVSDSQGIAILDVKLHHCGGMGVIAQRSRDIGIERMEVVPAPGKKRMISITADATHFSNCGGQIRLIDCTFENQKDDASNIHGLYMPVDTIFDRERIWVRWGHSGQYGTDFLVPGMAVEIVDNHTLEAYARRIVAKVERFNKEYSAVTFTEPLPENIRPGHLIAADEPGPDVHISGCRMSGNRARGLLIGSRGRVIIENNYFRSAGAAVLIEGDTELWFESGAVCDITTRNNLFEDCYTSGNNIIDGPWGWGEGVISISPSFRPQDADAKAYHRNIRIVGNTFRHFDCAVLFARSAEGLEFSRNRLERTRTYEPFYRPYNLFLDGCRKVRVAGNSFGPDFPGHNIGIVHMRPSEIVQRGGKPLEIICK